jgi:hypothetical protein
MEDLERDLHHGEARRDDVRAGKPHCHALKERMLVDCPFGNREHMLNLTQAPGKATKCLIARSSTQPRSLESLVRQPSFSVPPAEDSGKLAVGSVQPTLARMVHPLTCWWADG